MDTNLIVLIVVIALLVVVGAGVLMARRRRSEQLQDRYGPEYERTLEQTGDRKSAEAELAEREQRVAGLDIRELDSNEQERFRTSWAEIQRGFVDDPVRSVNDADVLVTEIMQVRGYPVDEDFDRRVADISVSHADVVPRYREARAVRDATRSGEDVDLDQQRHAVTAYRSLVEVLLGDGNGTHHSNNGNQQRSEEHTR